MKLRERPFVHAAFRSDRWRFTMPTLLIVTASLTVCSESAVAGGISTATATLLVEHSGQFNFGAQADFLSSRQESWALGDPSLAFDAADQTIVDGNTNWTGGASGNISGSASGATGGNISFGTSFSDVLSNPDDRPDTDFTGSTLARFTMSFDVLESTAVNFVDGIWYESIAFSTSSGSISRGGSSLIDGSGTATVNIEGDDLRDGTGTYLFFGIGSYTLVAEQAFSGNWNQWPSGGVGFDMQWSTTSSVPGPGGLAGLLGLAAVRRRRRR